MIGSARYSAVYSALSSVVFSSISGYYPLQVLVWASPVTGLVGHSSNGRLRLPDALTARCGLRVPHAPFNVQSHLLATHSVRPAGPERQPLPAEAGYR